MEKAKKNLELRSEELQEIMQRHPNWIIRWGNTVLLTILFVGLILCWMIKYPELIHGTVKLSTTALPVKVVSQSNGNLIQLFVKDGDVVQQGTILAEIENPLSARAVQYIEGYVAKLDNAVSQGSATLPIPDATGNALGDLQQSFNDLQKELSAYNTRRTFKMDDAEITSLQQRITHQQELLKINASMLEIHKNELENARKKFQSDSLLFSRGVISSHEFTLNQSEYHNKELQYDNLDQTREQAQVNLSALQLQLSQAMFNKDSRDKSTLEVINTFRKTVNSYIYGWQQKYRLYASVAGKVSFLRTLQPHQFCKAGEELFAVVQSEESIVGHAEVHVAGFGKVKVGEDVHILLDNFPNDEYGIVMGKVNAISLLPNGNSYRVEIALPEGMKSTRNIMLKYTPEMSGSVEIVTDDKTVMERIFKSIVKLFERK